MDCYPPTRLTEATRHSNPRQLPDHRRLKRSDADDYCAQYKCFEECSRKCSPNLLDAVIEQRRELTHKYCKPRPSEKFWASMVSLWSDLFSGVEDCGKHPEKDGGGSCRWFSKCVMGSALDKVKDRYSKDVVAWVTDDYKIDFGRGLVNDTSLPKACYVFGTPYDG